MSDKQFLIEWVDSFREPKCAPNPQYPNGIKLDVSGGKLPTCSVSLPYPAKRIGHYVVRCQLCGFCAACTTAGRPDDPCSITIPCQMVSRQEQ
jgi:hypothetical protein